MEDQLARCVGERLRRVGFGFVSLGRVRGVRLGQGPIAVAAAAFVVLSAPTSLAQILPSRSPRSGHSQSIEKGVLYSHDFGVVSTYECGRGSSGAHCHSRLYSTVDDGNSWEDITPGHLGRNGEVIQNFTWLNQRRGWVTSNDCAGSDAHVYRTIDGGGSWQRVRVAAVDCNAGSTLALDFVGPVHGWLIPTEMVGESTEFWATGDGGGTWTRVSHVDAPGTATFQNGDRGYVEEWGQRLFSTGDGAKHWTRRRMIKPARYRGGRAFNSVPTWFHRGYAVLPVTLMKDGVEDVAFFVTHDGGSTWRRKSVLRTHLHVPPRRQSSRLTSCVARRHVWWVTNEDQSVIWMSTDSGRTWSKRRRGLDSRVDLSAVGAHRAWALTYGNRRALYRTKDGGRHWRKIHPHP